jgi:hypothetical protein
MGENEWTLQSSSKTRRIANRPILQQNYCNTTIDSDTYIFRKLAKMAKLRIIPKRLAKCPTPTCLACLYAKAIWKPWHSRMTMNIDEATKPKLPGKCVSVDQLVSPTPGLIARMSGFLTMQRYKYLTVYVDQASRLSFVWLQSNCPRDSWAFEQYTKDRGISIQAYHTDNGIFRAHKWVMHRKTDASLILVALSSWVWWPQATINRSNLDTTTRL